MGDVLKRVLNKKTLVEFIDMLKRKREGAREEFHQKEGAIAHLEYLLNNFQIIETQETETQEKKADS